MKFISVKIKKTKENHGSSSRISKLITLTNTYLSVTTIILFYSLAIHERQFI